MCEELRVTHVGLTPRRSPSSLLRFREFRSEGPVSGDQPFHEARCVEG